MRARDDARSEGSGTAAAQPDPASPFELTPHQTEGVRRCLEVMVRRRGVLLADSVGLGKTYIGLALVERWLRGGGRVAVTTPAALRGVWREPLRRVAAAVGTRVWGVGASEGATTARPFLAWFSHARLSRGTFSREELSALDLVVVDEAHAFRNPGTRRYRALAQLCRGAHVVLITATPVNNTLADLYWLLRLFSGDGSFADVGVTDLSALTRPESHRETARVLAEVMVRRTRRQIQADEDETAVSNLRFPSRAPPNPVRYSLDSARPGLTAELLDAVTALTLAGLRADAYDEAATAVPDAAAELVRLGLLKRLESSLAAFRASVTRQSRFTEAFVSALDRGRILAPNEHGAFRRAGSTDGDVVQLVLEELLLRPLPATLDVDRLRRDALADLERLRWLRERLAMIPAEADPKLRRLRLLLDGELAGRKVVLFTEFRDTARALWQALVGRGGVGLIDGAGARLGAGPASRRLVIERFAPRANRARPPRPHERVDLLIATDVLAEGLNLHDAADVIGYDLPWNPVRMIQRIGRVDRLGSEYDLIRSHHFLPDDGLERILGIVGRLRRKLDEIGRTVGVESPVLDLADAAGERDAFDTLVQRLAGDEHGLLDGGELGLFEAVEHGVHHHSSKSSMAGRSGLDPASPDPAYAGLTPVRQRSAAALAARRVRSALALVPGGPDPDLCRRADAVLARLAQPLDSGTEIMVRKAVASPRGSGRKSATGSGRGPETGSRRGPRSRSMSAERLLDALERALAPRLLGTAPDLGISTADIVLEADPS